MRTSARPAKGRALGPPGPARRLYVVDFSATLRAIAVSTRELMLEHLWLTYLLDTGRYPGRQFETGLDYVLDGIATRLRAE
jgi:hypothetical protein